MGATASRHSSAMRLTGPPNNYSLSLSVKPMQVNSVTGRTAPVCYLNWRALLLLIHQPGF